MFQPTGRFNLVFSRRFGLLLFRQFNLCYVVYTDFPWDFFAIFYNGSTDEDQILHTKELTAITPKSLIFMRRYEDMNFPWDFLSLQVVVFDLRLCFQIGSNHPAKTEIGQNVWENAGLNVW